MDQTLDVSGLEPPEPMERILDALATLPEGDRLRVHHHREPFPLYPLLKSLDYRWHTQQQGPDAFDILIWAETGRATIDPSTC